MESISVAVVGAGGFGNNYVQALLAEAGQRNVTFAAAIDPAPEHCRALPEIRKRGIPLYPSLEAYLDCGGRADLIALATPLQLHSQQVIRALEAACHVICEKPLAASPQQVHQMVQARDKAAKEVAIGYQWSFAAAMQRLKHDILAGRLGAPRRLSTVTCWPRDSRYYARNDWAGRVCDAAGRLVLDSPANNACAHYLHCMFYLLGPCPGSSVMPASVTAELYRAHPIENYDTAAIRCLTTTGVELLFLASHVTRNNHDPVCRFEFDEATVLCGDDRTGHLRVCFKGGRTEDYGPLPGGDSMDKLWSVVDSIRTGRPVLCGIEAASAHTLSICAAQRSVPQISEFAKALVYREEMPTGGYRLIVDGLEEALQRCHREFRMPAELGVSWARPGTPVEIASLTRTPAESGLAPTAA